MAHFSHYPLQQAVYQALTSDGTLMGMVTGVYDRPPQGTAFPYINIGESSGSDWSSETTTGMEQNIIMHIWSRQGGRKEAATIMERLHTILHDADMAVDGQTLVIIRFTSSVIALENDGISYHGIMGFRALLEAA